MDINALKDQAMAAAQSALANAKTAAKDGIDALKEKGAEEKSNIQGNASAKGAELKDKASGVIDKLKDKGAALLREAADRIDPDKH